MPALVTARPSPDDDTCSSLATINRSRGPMTMTPSQPRLAARSRSATSGDGVLEVQLNDDAVTIPISAYGRSGSPTVYITTASRGRAASGLGAVLVAVKDVELHAASSGAHNRTDVICMRCRGACRAPRCGMRDCCEVHAIVESHWQQRAALSRFVAGSLSDNDVACRPVAALTARS